MDLKEKAIKLLDSTQLLSVASINKNGYPRVCILSKNSNKGLDEIYFSTGTNSAKTGHFKINPKAGITYYEGGDSVTLIGQMSIVEDKAIKDALWQDWYINHYPLGQEDPEYAILKFIPEEATIWIDNEFVTIKL